MPKRMCSWIGRVSGLRPYLGSVDSSHFLTTVRLISHGGDILTSCTGYTMPSGILREAGLAVSQPLRTSMESTGQFSELTYLRDGPLRREVTALPQLS